MAEPQVLKPCPLDLRRAAYDKARATTEICSACNGAGGDNNTYTCSVCGGSGGVTSNRARILQLEAENAALSTINEQIGEG